MDINTNTDSINSIKKISDVVEVERIMLTLTLKERIGKKHLKIAQAHNKKINVYRIVYQSQGHNVIGYIIEPKAGSKLPCIIYNRGGTGDFGMIKTGALFLDYLWVAQFAEWGYIVITTQYSGNAGGEGKDEMGGKDIADVLKLYKILKQYPKADTKNVGMYGESRGGMMLYLALAKVRWIKAGVSVGGLSNLFRQEKLRPEMKKHYKKIFGGAYNEKKKRSAVFWANKFSKQIPLLLMHGSADDRVSPHDSLQLAGLLQDVGIPYKLIIFEGGSHSLQSHVNEAKNATKRWFNAYLKNSSKKMPLLQQRRIRTN